MLNGVKREWRTDDGSVWLMQGDCLEILPQLEAGSVDCVITDPPFGVRSEDWDAMNDYEFARFSFAWLSMSATLCPSLCSFYASGTEFAAWCKFLFPNVRQMVWHKPLGSQYAGASEAHRWFAFEPIVHCFKKERWEVAKPKEQDVAKIIKAAREAKGLSRGGVDMAVRGKKTGLCYRWEESACLPTPEQVVVLKKLLSLNGELDTALQQAVAERDDTLEKMNAISKELAAEKTDVLTYRTVTNGCHPCEKPVDMLADLVGTLTQPGQTVGDWFAGSASCGLACIKSGRKYIGIENDSSHYETAVARITEELNRYRAFESVPKITQRSMFDATPSRESDQ